MEQQHAADDQSHYEISLTAGQAFVAFVLLLLSLAAAFAFGLMLGKGQADERLVVRKETPVVTEANLARSKSDGRIIDLGVPEDDFESAESDETVPATKSDAATEGVDMTSSAAIVSEAATQTAAPAAGTPRVIEEAAPQSTEAVPAAHAAETPAARPAEKATVPAATPVRTPEKAEPAPEAAMVHYAQLLSTQDKKTAETLAVRLINGGFKSAYVERGSTDKGAVYRVRVRFASEIEARAAVSKLKAYSKDVWITAR